MDLVCFCVHGTVALADVNNIDDLLGLPGEATRANDDINDVMFNDQIRMGKSERIGHNGLLN